MIEYNGKYVTIMLCSQCNNNCKHCYARYDGRFSDEELQKIITKLNKKYRILLNGTEPILFPEYFKYFKYVNEHRILTNGIEIFENPKVLRQLMENDINEVWLSYHFEIQDDLSKIKIHELHEVIKLLKEKDFIVKLMCSLSINNYRNISKYCEEAIDLGVDKIKFTNFISQGNAKDNFADFVFLNQAQIDYVLGQIDLIRKKTLKSELIIERCGTFGPNINKTNFECLAGNNMVVITPNKKIYNCVFDIAEDSCIGYIDDEYRIFVDDKKINHDTSYCKVLRKYNGIGK